MKQSQLLLSTKKAIKSKIEIASHQLLIRGDFIEELAAGIYSFLPLGFLVLKNIEKIIREEMINLGAQELFLPALQPKELWAKTTRWKKMDPPLFKLKDRHQKDFALAPTHEEVITQIAQKRIYSFRDLPKAVFQVQTKFRNEMRATGGLLRQREFLMKDLYSLHQTEKEAILFYEKVKNSYFKIFRRCGLSPFLVEASSGTIGGTLSHEFMVESPSGEDRILICKKCGFGANMEKIGNIKNCQKCKGRMERKNAIEVGHVFYLSDKYSKSFNLKFSAKDGQKSYVKMGCFGIGLPRLMAASVEINHDERGIVWPKEIAPFLVHLIPIPSKNNAIQKEIEKTSDFVYHTLQKSKINVLYDDRKNRTPGEKFADADLIGIPIRVVISEKTLSKESTEIKERKEKEGKLVKIKKIINFLVK
ncbi:MAG: proline--tRNA ligase [Parcubacteria group bacterium CG_4_9_14_0_2_um_filter_35_11]|nr:MAG: proline--tRNA ligase [Parcubacteria group bacterium CG07_land_8_20_14_0_80_35_11]PJC47829.1 MAG: proline--tRNA ligase [Parcubacteria group bacterium CG_4_9_14_0_2_um_filter_35_11]